MKIKKIEKLENGVVFILSKKRYIYIKLKNTDVSENIINSILENFENTLNIEISNEAGELKLKDLYTDKNIYVLNSNIKDITFNL